MVSAALVPRTALYHHECHLLAQRRRRRSETRLHPRPLPFLLLRQKKGTLYVTLTKFD